MPKPITQKYVPRAEQVHVEKSFKTSDGQRFDKEEDAITHESAYQLYNDLEKDYPDWECEASPVDVIKALMEKGYLILKPKPYGGM